MIGEFHFHFASLFICREAAMKYYSKSDIIKYVDAGKKKTIRVYNSLYLEIRSKGNASWVFRFQMNNHRSQMVIGVYSDTNPELMCYDKAMKQVIDYNAMVLNGDNPKLDKLLKKYHAERIGALKLNRALDSDLKFRKNCLLFMLMIIF